jgi:hypothetical protein
MIPIKILALGGVAVLLLILARAVIFGRSSDRKTAPVAQVADGKDDLLIELNAWYAEPPAGQNDAGFYVKGFDALRLANLGALPILGNGRLPALGTPMTASMKSALAAVVRSNQAALRVPAG